MNQPTRQSPAAPTRLAATTLLALAAGLTAPATTAAPPAATRVFFGTYDSDTSRGIYTATWDPATGTLGAPQLAAATPSPSFIALAPNRQFIVAVNENGTPQNPGGAVTSWKLNPATGALSPVSEQPSQGSAPCHIAVSADSRTVIIANYGGGSFASYRLNPDGSLSSPVTFVQNQGLNHPDRAAVPRGHSGTFSPDGSFAYFCDLGLDRIFGRRVTAATSTLDPLNAPDAALTPRSGPRHFAFHPTLPVAYVINETASTVTTLTYDAPTGALSPVETLSTLPENRPAQNSTAHITVHPSGQWVYGSNRGHNSIARFNVNPATGRLQFAGTTPSGGAIPRNFAIDPTGRWLLAAHQESNSVVVHSINPTTGAPEPTATSLTIGKPVCIAFY